MGWENEVIEIRENPEKPYFCKFKYPRAIQLEKLLKWYVDLHRPVSRYFIFILSQFADGMHKEKLEEMSSKTLEGRNEYHRYVTKEHRNALEVLWDFASISQIPLNYFLEGIGLMQPRDEIYAAVHKGKLVHPPAEAPVIFIATGTGISPLWSLVNSRINNGQLFNLFFFGTRHPDHDFYYKEQIETLNSSEKCRFFVAFSQTTEKKHVQNLIEEQWEIVNHYLLSDPYIFVCGKFRNLCKSIKVSFLNCLKNQLSAAEAEELIQTLTKKNRFYTENW